MSDVNQTSRQDHNDEITLKEIAVAVRDFVRLAVNKWWLFAGLFILIGGYLLYSAYTTPPVYKARFTFMVNEDEGNGMNGIGSILGRFGLGARKGRMNLDKILELSKSRRIVQETIFAIAEVDSTEDYIANHIITEYELDVQWEKKSPELSGFRFIRDSVAALDEIERSVLLRVYRVLVGKVDVPGLVSGNYSDESSILTLNVETTNPDLSLVIVTHLFENLSAFYIGQTIERQKATYDVVKTKVDSVAGLLAEAEYTLATSQDVSQNVLFRVDKLKIARLRRKVMVLSTIQTEAVKNLEIADFTLKTATPFIQEIDRPISPLTPKVKSKIKAIVIGALLAFILGSLFILMQRLRAQLLQD